ncbi:MAG: DUF421 domain-containing protein [Gammaproteobacteria bacterium]|nr:DUF421 domain-containing protein [Gammaproteobacteria bacterium]
MAAGGSLALQVLAGWGYYLALVGLFRLAGKRLAGQTTTFDLIVLITLAVVLQQVALFGGPANALAFIVAVFSAHRALAYACTRSTTLKRLVRGGPRPLVRAGTVSHAALEAEGLTYEDLLAGLRKSGVAGLDQVELAMLEETGQISVVLRHEARDTA